ncbi:MAG: NAD(P)H-hydrate dehydratase [Chitinophagaceae bacterium]|nr:NAD(P)H-hydrate dehydratase [Chitinophagaceae bacterium]
MKLLTTSQIKEWDAYTIAHEPINSIDLMERAATKCAEWIIHNDYASKPLHIFCGKGNNGGDGLAIARLLLQKGAKVTIYVLEFGHKGTDDFQTNLRRLHPLTYDIHFIQSEDFFPHISSNDVVIDAMLGTGLSKPLEGITEKLVIHLNQCGATGIAIDVPTGMYADKSCREQTVFHAAHTLTFQNQKLCFMMHENHEAFGEVHVLNIQLHQQYEATAETSFYLIDEPLIKSIYKKRKAFTHKGTYGHALMLTGSYGKMGAAVLMAEACLRSGAGLATVHVPQCGYTVVQSSLHEAMVETDHHQFHITQLPKELHRYTSIGLGPGMGLHEETARVIAEVLHQTHQPMVLDADALNLLSIKQNLQEYLHDECILTPHPKEFERLFGKCSNDFERMQLALHQAVKLNVYIVLKTHHTLIACPDGKAYFNSTGNAGMATAGSGDVLSGLLTGLLAQGYTAEDACVLGVYLHGLAGDIAATSLSKEAMIAGDITRHLGKAFLQLQ